MTADITPVGDRHGDTTFETLYVQHVQGVYQYVVRRLGPSLAEDICSQTFVIAWEQRERFDATKGNARAWLLGIATNLIRRHHRAEARQMRAYARTGVDPTVADTMTSLVARVDAQAHWPRVAAVVAGLRPEDRELLWLCATSDLTYAELADVVGIPVGTVRSRLSRLRRRIEEACDPGPTSGSHGSEGGAR